MEKPINNKQYIKYKQHRPNVHLILHYNIFNKIYMKSTFNKNQYLNNNIKKIFKQVKIKNRWYSQRI